MELKINIHKHGLYILSLLIVVVGGVLFVQGGNGTPNPGHDASAVLININGTFMTLQDAFDGGNLTTSVEQINGCAWEGVMCSCAYDGSSGEYGDAIIGLKCEDGTLTDVMFKKLHISHSNGWCPSSYSGCTFFKVG